MPPRSAVLLIDEHDAPLIDHLDNEVQRTAAAAILAGLYQVIKDLPDKLRCVFVTGIMRYKDLGLGSAGNSFTDISDLPRFGACCGYTRAELKQYFSPYLRCAASVRLHKTEDAVTAADLEQLLDDLSEWYDGFCFDEKHLTRVFSTWSMLRFFEDEYADFKPHWAKEDGLGLPQLLTKALPKLNLQEMLQELNQGYITVPLMDYERSAANSHNLVNDAALLSQAGYLTFVDSIVDTGEVRLNCPNIEVRQTFYNVLAQKLNGKAGPFGTASFAKRAKAALLSLDPQQILEYFNLLFKTIPYQHYPVTSESTVAALISFNLSGAGLEFIPEETESLGRADTVINLRKDGLSVVFEYKFTKSNDEKQLNKLLSSAVSQIQQRDYGHHAQTMNKVARFALVFSGHKSRRCFVRCQLVDVLNKAAG